MITKVYIENKIDVTLILFNQNYSEQYNVGYCSGKLDSINTSPNLSSYIKISINVWFWCNQLILLTQ